MKILVTGSAGFIGKAIVTRLVEQGHTIRAIDRQPNEKLNGAEFVICDITDYPALRDAVRGCEAVVHMAAILHPAAGTSEDIFRINASGTFNVFQAAAEEGIHRVVQASSINAVGYYFGPKPFSLQYLPVDEDHLCITTDPYSFSKVTIEEIGKYFWRREAISSVALRFPAVIPAQYHDRVVERKNSRHARLEELLELSEDDQRHWLEENLQSYNEQRARRVFEDRKALDALRSLDSFFGQEMWGLMSARHNFWALIDERDAVLAIERGLTASYEGSHPLFICDRENFAGIDSGALAKLFYPEVVQHKHPLVGMESLVNIERARQLIGFEPRYSFNQI